MRLPIRDARTHGSILRIVARQLRQNKNLVALATTSATCALKGQPATITPEQITGLVIVIIILIALSTITYKPNGWLRPNPTGTRSTRRR
ncbi:MULTISPECIES: hypothetical protein [Kitasatospora]|uniref:hypothetical protein n=1 Tax=Kitasatospora TaxID=2063 RepID=UPI0011D2441D|nr:MULTISPECIES: hypothetical protein [Kitasatospora]